MSEGCGVMKGPWNLSEPFIYMFETACAIIEYVQTLLQAKPHETSFGRQDQPRVHTFTPDDPICWFLQFHHERSGANGVRGPGGDDETIAGFHGNRLEAF